jgi:hypothetical protein
VRVAPNAGSQAPSLRVRAATAASCKRSESRRFGLSPWWGRLRVAEVHAEAAAASNGRHPGRDVPHEEREHDPARAQPDDGPTDAAVGRRAEPASDNTNGSRQHPERHTAGERRPPEDEPTPVGPLVHGITTLAVLAVTLVAAVASYDHQRALAELAGEGWRARLLPVSVAGVAWPPRCRCWCAAVPACPLDRSPGHRCSPASVRAWPPTSLRPIPRWSAGSWPPGRRSLSCSLGAAVAGPSAYSGGRES